MNEEYENEVNCLKITKNTSNIKMGQKIEQNSVNNDLNSSLKFSSIIPKKISNLSEKEKENIDDGEEVSNSFSFMKYIYIAFVSIIILILIFFYFINMNSFRIFLVDEEINKSIFDDKSYTVIKLKNNMLVFLIHKPETPISYAAMSVHVGSKEDPNEILGLAHFTEHMLFDGTSKYPGSSQFEDFISSNSGSSNAFTEFEKTTYYFNIIEDKLYEALEMFSWMFKDPLFRLEAIDLEIEAVNSEYNKDLNLFPFYNDMLLKTFANNPFNKFSIGNRESLRRYDLKTLQERLFRFFNSYYYSSNMSLAIVSSKSIPELMKIASNLFSDIPDSKDRVVENSSKNITSSISKTKKPNIMESKRNKNERLEESRDSRIINEIIKEEINSLKKRDKSWNNISIGNKHSDTYFNQTSLNKFVHAKVNTNSDLLQIFFILKPSLKYYKTKPLEYICYLMNYNGHNSLKDKLIKMSLIENIKAEIYENVRSVSILLIQAELTNKGIDNSIYVQQSIFSYLDFLKETESVKPDLYNDLDVINYNYFEYLDQPSDYTDFLSDITFVSFDIDLRNILNYSYNYSDFNKKLITSFLNDMKKESSITMLITFKDPNISELKNVEYHIEQYFNITYKTIDNLDINVDKYKDIIDSFSDNVKLRSKNYNKNDNIKEKILYQENLLKECDSFSNSKKSRSCFLRSSTLRNRIKLYKKIKIHKIEEKTNNYTDASNSDKNSTKTNNEVRNGNFSLRSINQFAILQPIIFNCKERNSNHDNLEFRKKFEENDEKLIKNRQKSNMNNFKVEIQNKNSIGNNRTSHMKLRNLNSKNNNEEICFHNNNNTDIQLDIIYKTENIVIYSYPDKSFKIPKSEIRILISGKSENLFFFRMMYTLLKNRLELVFQNFIEAGNDFSINFKNNTISLKFKSFTSHSELSIQILIDELNKILSTENIEEDSYSKIFGIVYKYYSLWSKTNSPLEKANDLFKSLIFKRYVFTEDSLNFVSQNLENIDSKKIKNEMKDGYLNINIRNDSNVNDLKNKTTANQTSTSTGTYGNKSTNSEDIEIINHTLTFSEFKKVLNYQKFKEFIEEYKSTLYMKSLISGVLSQGQIKRISQELKKFVEKQKSSIETTANVLNVPDNELKYYPSGIYYKKVFNSFDLEVDNSLMTNFIINTHDTFDELSLKMIGLIISNEFYKVLRVEKAYGYIARSGIETLNSKYSAFKIEVLGNKEYPSIIDKEADLLLESIFKNKILKLTEYEFSRLKYTLKQQLNSQKTSDSAYKFLWNEIITERLDFKRNEQILNALENIKIKDITDFFKNYFIEYPEKISVEIISKKYEDTKFEKKAENFESKYLLNANFTKTDIDSIKVIDNELRKEK